MSESTEAQDGSAIPLPQHSPGPWCVRLMSSGEYAIESETSGHIAVVMPHPEGDATLIAAAPDLLTALKAAVEALDAFDVANEMTAELRWMRAQIAKAKGRAQ